MVEQKWSLFVVEAHPDVQRALSARLERDQELQVVGSSAWAPALELLRAVNPDVILLGLSQRYQSDLPHLESAIREMAAVSAVMVLTPYVDDAESQRLLGAGAAGYLLKTIDSEALIGVVKEVAASGYALMPPALPVAGQ